MTDLHRDPQRHLFSRRMFLGAGIGAAIALVPHSSPANEEILVSFGLISDLHYSRRDHHGERYYRDSIRKLDNALTAFDTANVDCVIELGDFIDASGKRKDEIENLRIIDEKFSEYHKKRHYVVGNHDLQCFDKREFLGHINQRHSQYSFDVNGVHCVVMDACYNPDGSPYKLGNFAWRDSFMPRHSLDWLADDLCQAAGNPVFGFIHHPLHRNRGPLTVSNAAEVRAVLESHGNVRAVFQGHAHYGGYAEVNGIHYLALKAAVTGSIPGNNSFAVASLRSDGAILVDGFLNQPNATW